MFKALAASAVLATLAAAAPAATLTWGPTPTAGVVANPAPVSVAGAFHHNVTGSEAGVRRSPFEGLAAEGSEPYSAVTGSATFAFDGLRDGLSFVWGSPDTYNTIEFLLGGVVVDSVQGTGNGANLSEAWATFTNIGATGLFDGFRLHSGAPAFEFAGVAGTPAAVPLPAGGVLLLTALGAAGLVRRRAGA